MAVHVVSFRYSRSSSLFKMDCICHVSRKQTGNQKVLLHKQWYSGQHWIHFFTKEKTCGEIILCYFKETVLACVRVHCIWGLKNKLILIFSECGHLHSNSLLALGKHPSACVMRGNIAGNNFPKIIEIVLSQCFQYLNMIWNKFFHGDF